MNSMMGAWLMSDASRSSRESVLDSDCEEEEEEEEEEEDLAESKA